MLAVAACLYCLHRLCLKLESMGLLFYLNRKSSTGAASCFVAAREFIEPDVQHVEQVSEQIEIRDENALPKDSPLKNHLKTQGTE